MEKERMEIDIYAEDFREDIWEEEYCDKLGVSRDAKCIRITVEKAEEC